MAVCRPSPLRRFREREEFESTESACPPAAVGQRERLYRSGLPCNRPVAFECMVVRWFVSSAVENTRSGDFVTWLIIGGLALLIVFLVFRPRSVLRVRVRLKPQGQAIFSFLPDETADNHLALLVLLYAAKIRYLLHSEPTESTSLFRKLTLEAAEAWSDATPGTLLRATPTGSVLLKEFQTIWATVPRDETYEVQLYAGGPARPIITNSLPVLRGHTTGLPWHYLFLLEQVHARLPHGPRIRLGVAFRDLLKSLWLDPNAGKGLRGLNSFTVVARDVWTRTADL